MMKAILGSHSFKQSVLYYIQSKTKNTRVPVDLYESFQQFASDQSLPAPVEEILETWIDLPGHSVVKVSRQYSDLPYLSITQKRYFINIEEVGSNILPEQFIPISMTCKDEPNFEVVQPNVWLLPETPMRQYFPSFNISNSSWIIANLQSTGFYRVNYDDDNWQLLIDELNDGDHKLIHVMNRAQLIDDSFNLAKSGEISFSIAFDLLNYLHQEKEFIPWRSAAKAFAYLDRMLSGTKYTRLLHFFVRNLTESIYPEFSITKSNTDNVFRLQRIDVTKIACSFGLETCVDEANALILDVVSI